MMFPAAKIKIPKVNFSWGNTLQWSNSICHSAQATCRMNHTQVASQQPVLFSTSERMQNWLVPALKSRTVDKFRIIGWGRLNPGTSRSLYRKVSTEMEMQELGEREKRKSWGCWQTVYSERNNESRTIGTPCISEVWNGVTAEDTNYIRGSLC